MGLAGFLVVLPVLLSGCRSQLGVTKRVSFSFESYVGIGQTNQAAQIEKACPKAAE